MGVKHDGEEACELVLNRRKAGSDPQGDSQAAARPRQKLGALFILLNSLSVGFGPQSEAVNQVRGEAREERGT